MCRIGTRPGSNGRWPDSNWCGRGHWWCLRATGHFGTGHAIRTQAVAPPEQTPAAECPGSARAPQSRMPSPRHTRLPRPSDVVHPFTVHIESLLQPTSTRASGDFPSPGDHQQNATRRNITVVWVSGTGKHTSGSHSSREARGVNRATASFHIGATYRQISDRSRSWSSSCQEAPD